MPHNTHTTFNTRVEEIPSLKINVFMSHPVGHRGEWNDCFFLPDLPCAVKKSNKPKQLKVEKCIEKAALRQKAARTPNQSPPRTWHVLLPSKQRLAPCLLAPTRHKFCILLFNWDSRGWRRLEEILSKMFRSYQAAWAKSTKPITRRWAPPAEPPRLDYDSRRCFVNAPPPAAVLPVHAQIDCKPLQSFRPGSKKEIQLNQYLISRPINKLSNVSLKKKSIQRCFAVQS